MEQNAKQLLAARARIADRIKIYAKKQYDARPMLPEFNRLTKVLQSMGRSVRIENQVFTEKYWEDPAKYARQYLNKNPIIDARDGDLIWASERTGCSSQKDISAAQGASRCTIIKVKDDDQMKPRRTTIEPEPQKKPVQPYYYKVNISWAERNDTPKDVINELEEFIKGAGLELVKIHDFDNGHEIEKTAEYKMLGGEEAFRWVKRCIMSHLMRFVGGIPKFDIMISGKRYEDFEMTK